MRAGGSGIRTGDGLRTRLREDAGTMTILITGVLVVVLMVIALGVAITGVHLERSTLQDAADVAALAGTQGIDEAGLYTPGNQAVITPALARKEAEAHLARYPLETSRLRDVHVDRVAVAGDGTVSVTLSASVDPPLIGWFTRGTGMRIPLSAQGESRAR